MWTHNGLGFKRAPAVLESGWRRCPAIWKHGGEQSVPLGSGHSAAARLGPRSPTRRTRAPRASQPLGPGVGRAFGCTHWLQSAWTDARWADCASAGPLARPTGVCLAWSPWIWADGRCCFGPLEGPGAALRLLPGRGCHRSRSGRTSQGGRAGPCPGHRATARGASGTRRSRPKWPRGTDFRTIASNG